MRRATMRTLLRHFLSLLVLPFTMTVVVPAVLLHSSQGIHLGGNFIWPLRILIMTTGVTIAAAGLALMVKTNMLFAKVGDGTLAPWDPPKQLVIQGIYRHVRNPMMSGVFAILTGETVFFFSKSLLIWSGCFIAFNLIFIPLEELGLEKKFGEDYRRYKTNVSRWIPRLKPWEPEPGTKADG